VEGVREMTELEWRILHGIRERQLKLRYGGKHSFILPFPRHYVPSGAELAALDALVAAGLLRVSHYYTHMPAYSLSEAAWKACAK
jgi:hypothetical protein